MASAGNFEMEDDVSVLKQPTIDDEDWKQDGEVVEVGDELLDGSSTAGHYLEHDDNRMTQKTQMEISSQESDSYHDALEHLEINTKLIEHDDDNIDDHDTMESNGFNEKDKLNREMSLQMKTSEKNDGKNVNMNKGIRERLFTDPIFKSKMLRTVILWWSMFVLGWRSSLTGPTFPDLRQIIGKDLSTASWILTALSGGGLIGSAAGGALYDRYNGPGLFVTFGAGVAVTTAIIPWCSHFLAMVLAQIASGAFKLALDIATSADVIRLWHENPGPAIQFVHFGFSIGAILSPFVSEPFLSKPLSSVAPNASHDANSLAGSVQKTMWTPDISANTTTGNVLDSTIEGATNMTLDRAIPIDSEIGLAALNNSFVINSDQLIYGETNIYIVYVISAAISMTLVLLLVLEHLISGSIHLDKTEALRYEKNTGDKAVKEYNLSTAYKAIFTILMSIMLMFYIIIERTYVSFLMTFVISRLNWSKAGGSTATSTFWLTLAAGRLLSVYTLKLFKLGIVIISNMVIVLVGVSLFWLSVILGNTALCWASVALVGLGMSVVCGSAFSWLSDNVVPVRGKISSVLYVVSSVGSMAFPLLTGYLMNEVSYDWFVYLLMILVVMMIVIFVFVEVLYKYVK